MKAFLMIYCIIFGSFFILLIPLKCYSQTSNTQIALPFLLIAPDARAAGMGNVGVSTAPDVYSLYWNAAKYAFAQETSGIGFSITPWKRQLAEDMVMFYLSGYHRVDELQTIAASAKYFVLGKNVFTDSYGNEISSYKPMDLSLDFAYVRKLSEVFSLSTTLKYVRSDVAALDFVKNQGLIGQAFAADVGVFYYKPIYINGKEGSLAFGVGVANLGPNIKYGSVNLPMPILAKFGGSFRNSLDSSITYALSIELNKDFGEKKSGIPNISTGIEVLLADKFAIRTGYYQSETVPEWGKYITAGLGLDYLNFSLNLSYLFPTQELSLMNNTVRYGIGYSFGKRK